MNVEIHHIGFVVEDIENNIQIFETIGFKKEGNIVEDLNQNNYLQMMVDCKGNKLELIQPMNEKSSVNKNSLGIHHIAITTDDEEEFIRTIKENKMGKIFINNISAPLFNNKNVSFGYLKNNLLFEIVNKF